MLIRETEILRTTDNNSNNKSNNNNNCNDKNGSLTESKDQNEIENTEKELNWTYCYHAVLTLIKPAFFKLLRGVTAVGSVLTGKP